MRRIERLASLLKEEGADIFGICEAEPVEEKEWAFFENWLANGYHAGMKYMERYPEIRKDPRLLLEDAKSIISIAYNYRQHNPYSGQLATYALGQDYHKVLRRRLKRVIGEMRDEFGGNWRICIDSAPILERYWAQKCGIGKRSEIHGNIVVPGLGSMVFLGEIITSLELPCKVMRLTKHPSSKNEEDVPDACVCPTSALQKGGMVDAGKCINYLTIELQEEPDENQVKLIGKALFGCDICQRACRENQGINPDVIPEFRPMEGLKEFLGGDKSEFDINNSPIQRSKIFGQTRSKSH